MSAYGGQQLAFLPSAIDADFADFHHRNPSVYTEIVRLARAANSRGQHLGIGCLWEVLRYSLSLDLGDDGLKLNNNYRAGYARLIMANERDLVGYFEVRRLRRPDDYLGSDDG